MDNIGCTLLALLVPSVESGAQQSDGQTCRAEVRVVEDTIMMTLVCIYCVPDMSSTTVTTPTTEVNIMEEKQ